MTEASKSRLAGSLRTAGLKQSSSTGIATPDFVAVASALHAAHERQIIHRDIKPGNIFLIPGKRREKVKLLDFGVATVHDVERHEESLTPAGCAVGTVNYIPPELVLGKRADKRADADIYSLGVTLYKMVTGQLPFRSDVIGPARDHQIMQMHVQKEPESPVGSSPRYRPNSMPLSCDACKRARLSGFSRLIYLWMH